MRVLVIEDEPAMGAAICRGLADAGIVADLSVDAVEAFELTTANCYDVVVLDVMLGRVDGFEVAARLRFEHVWVPILMLTARDAIDDRVRGLDAGADDYMTKPFSLSELLARLRALARRTPVERPAVLEVGGLRLDPATRQTWRDEREIDLTRKEFNLLETFMRGPGQVFSQGQLLDAAWELGYEQRSNVVEAHIRSLRDKIDRPFDTRSLETVRGIGYRLRPDGGMKCNGSRSA